MTELSNETALVAWLKDKPPEFACALAARVALRLAPILNMALRADADARRASIVLPSFGALATVRFAGTWPERVGEIRSGARDAVCEAVDAVSESCNRAQMEVVDLMEAIPEEYGFVTEAKVDAEALGVVSRVIDGISHAIQAAIDLVDAGRGVASHDAVMEAAISAINAAEFAVDGANDYRAFHAASLDDWDSGAASARHIDEFWKSVALDANYLEKNSARSGEIGGVVEGLSQTPLWPNGIPIWASRRWAIFKDQLPDDEGWAVWIDWYEGLLVGRLENLALELVAVAVARDDWTQGPGHVNRLIAMGINAPGTQFHKNEPKLTGKTTYQVALSFAGKQRGYVEEVARHLLAKSIAVFYDGFETAFLWGKDGAEVFHEAFAERSAYVVMFISSAYAKGPWTRHERRSAMARMIREDKEFVLPVRFDDTPIPGLPDSTLYVSVANNSPAQLASLIAEKLGISAFDGKASDVPAPRMISPIGEVVFNYSNFNGRYVIGSGTVEFETMWTKGSNKSIYVYNDSDSINGVAVARRFNSIYEITDAAKLDYTSRYRSPAVGQIVILRNRNGFYAAMQILEIKDDTRDNEKDELRFRYAIQTDGTEDFTKFRDI